VPSDPKLLQQFMGTNEYIGATNPKMRELYLQRFQALPEAEQQSLVSGLTPAKDPSAGFRPPGVPSVQQETLEEGITAPSTLIPLAAGGVSLRAGAALPMAYRWATRPLVEGGLQTLGEVGGQVMETGKPPTLGDVTKSLALNILPPSLEEGGRLGLRQLGRSSRGGQAVLSDEAAQRAEGMGQRVFASEPEPRISAMFDRVRASKVKLDMGDVQAYLGTLTPDEQRLLLREVDKFNLPLSHALRGSGTPGGPSVRGWDIGELQDLRSNILTALQTKKTPEMQDLLHNLRESVDDAIGAGKAVGSVPDAGTSALLKEAQGEWRRLRAGDELQDLVTKHTKSGPNLTYSDLKLSALADELKGTGRAATRLDRHLGTAERERLSAELAQLSTLYPDIKISGQVEGGVTVGSILGATHAVMSGQPEAAGAALLPIVIAGALRSPRVMEAFRGALANGRGEISSNTLAILANVVRQETMPVTSPRESPRAPTVPSSAAGVP
jgi:hypothetical protein